MWDGRAAASLRSRFFASTKKNDSDKLIANEEIEYFYADRPLTEKIRHAILKLIVSLAVMFAGFSIFIVLPFMLLYPIVLAMQPSSLLLIILFPCCFIYGAMLASVAFRKGKAR